MTRRVIDSAKKEGIVKMTSDWLTRAPAHSGDAERESLKRLHGVIAELFQAVSNALLDKDELAEQCRHRANALLETVIGPPGVTNGAPRPAGTHDASGLAPWQIRRVIAHIDANIDSEISNKDLAGAVRLSPGYFCHAFKASVGETPHGYVIRRRLQRAQGLMLSTDATLGQIALDCGLADQSHFTRLFRRLVGESPGAWRRARATAAMQTQ